MRPRLIADGGEITVGRKTASFVYGSFTVRLPEGRQQEDQPAGQQDGYIYRPDTYPQGRFDAAFVRADATNDLESQYSDLETVIDSAQKRSDGDVFFEQDITGRGLGVYRPGQDYDAESIVDVVIWGKTMPLPVTAIEMTSGAGGVAGWRVHVGGQLIADAEALRSNNDKLLALIEHERRQQLRKIGAVEKTATASQTTATAAQRAASNADAKAVSAGAEAELAKKDSAAAMAKAVDANTMAVDANKRAIEANGKAIQALGLVVGGMPRLLHIDTNNTNVFTKSYGELNNGADFGTLRWSGGALSPHGEVLFTATGTWTGAVLLHAVAGNGSSDVSVERITATQRRHNSIAGALFQNYKSATLWIFPDPT